MHVPSINNNLIYVSTITDQDMKVEFVKSGCFVKDKHDHYKVIAIGVSIGIYNHVNRNLMESKVWTLEL